MRMPGRSAITAAVLLMAPGVACAQASGGILKVYDFSNPPSASIHEEGTISTIMPFMGVFNNLVIFDQHAKQNAPEAIVPDLATEWAWSDDGTKLTFQLRQGVLWHDGKPFTSADVKCTWDMITEKRQSGWRKNPRKAWYFNLKEVTTEGDFQVTFHLGRPQPSFLTMLAGGVSPVYPCHVDGRTMRSKPIGTGPFKVAEFKPKEFIKLTRNENYWKPGKPYLDGSEWQIVTSRSTRILGFIAGQFDLTFSQDVSIPLLKDVRSQAPDAHCQVSPHNIQGQLLINRDAPPFDNEKIRRAMMLSIDRAAFIDILSEGQDKIGGFMLAPPEGLWGLTPDQLADIPGFGANVDENREQARGIMRELGYGPENPLRIKVATRDLAVYRDPAVILVDQLRQSFIEGELEIIETSLWYTTLARKDFHVAMNVGGSAIDDPDITFYEHFACGSPRNYTNYCNRDMEALFERQSGMLDQAERKKLVGEIDRKLQEEGARTTIYQTRAATCWHAHVKGLTLANNSQYNHWRMEDVWLDRSSGTQTTGGK